MSASGHFGTYQPVRSLRPQPPSTAPRGTRSSRRMIFKRLCLIVAALVFGFFLFSVENTAKLLTYLTATVAGPPSIPQLKVSSSPSDSGESSVAKSEPNGSEDRVSTLVEPLRSDVETPTSEALLRQFEAWAAEQDAQQLATVQPDQDRSPSPKTNPNRVVDETVSSTGLDQKDRGSRSAPKARVRASPQQSNESRHIQHAGVQAAPPQRAGSKFSQASGVRN
jgi:hypothetical protein